MNCFTLLYACAFLALTLSLPAQTAPPGILAPWTKRIFGLSLIERVNAVAPGRGGMLYVGEQFGDNTKTVTFGSNNDNHLTITAQP